jgi:hypothetical protein
LARNPKVGVALALVCAASMWFYVERILVPHQRSESAASDKPRGNLSDLYPRWLGARELLLHHRNPYSPEITREIQRGYYGRELDRHRPSDPVDEQAFAYPVYVTFLLAPIVGLPFEAVRAGFLWFLIAITVASVWLWLRAIGWKLTTSAASMIVLLTLGSFPVVQGLKLQQLTLLVAFLTALGLVLLVKGRLFLSGFVLAMATIKPQLVAPLLVCLLLWTVSDWAQRQRLFWGLAVTIAALLGASQVLLPGWLADFRSALRAYRQYVGGKSLLDHLLSPAIGQLFSVLALAIVLLIWWPFRKAHADSREFQYMIAVTLAVTLLVIPMFAPYNQVLLLPAILLVVREGRDLWNKSMPSRTSCVLTGAVLGWPWVVSVACTIASPWPSLARLERGWAIPLYASFVVIPLVLLIPLGSLVESVWRRWSLRTASMNAR